MKKADGVVYIPNRLILRRRVFLSIPSFRAVAIFFHSFFSSACPIACFSISLRVAVHSPRGELFQGIFLNGDD